MLRMCKVGAWNAFPEARQHLGQNPWLDSCGDDLLVTVSEEKPHWFAWGRRQQTACGLKVWTL